MDESIIYWYTFELRARAIRCIKEFLQDFNKVEIVTFEVLAIYAHLHGKNKDLLVIKK